MADVDMQRLVVSLEAQVNKFQKAMDGAAKVADTRSTQIERRFKQTNDRVSAGMASVGRNALSAQIASERLAAGMSKFGGTAQLVRPVIGNLNQLPPALTKTTAALKNTTANMAALSRAGGGLGSVFGGIGAALGAASVIEYANAWTRMTRSIEGSSQVFGIGLKSAEQLTALANDSRVDVEAYSKLYIRTSAAIRDYGFEAGTAEKVTTTLAKALKLGGANASEQTSVLLQFSQALQKGKLDGDEFRTVMENAGVVQELLAKRLNVSKGAIVQMAAAGKLQIKDLVGAMVDGGDQVDRIFRQMPQTIDEAFAVMRNNVIQFIGEADKASGASEALSAGIVKVSQNLDKIAVAAGAILGSAALRMTAFAAASVSAANPLTLIAAALGAMAVAYGVYGDEVSISNDKLATLKDSVQAFASVLNGEAKAAVEDAIDWMERHGVSVSDFASRFSGASETIQDKARKLGEELNELGGAMDGLVGKAARLWLALNRAPLEFITDGAVKRLEQTDTFLDKVKTKADDIALARGIEAANFGGGLADARAGKKEGRKDLPGPTASDEKRSSFERDVEQIKKRTAALQAELQTINETVIVQEKAKAAAELRASLDETARKRGTAAAREEIAAVETLAATYAEAQAQAAMMQAIKAKTGGIEDLRNEISLMGLFGEALTEARVQQELLNEAKRLGVALTPEVLAQIDATAQQTAALTAQRDAILDVRDASKEMLSSFVSDMRQGVSATEALGNALNKLADRLLDSGLDALVSGLVGGAGASLFGGGATTSGWGATVTPFANGGIAKNGKPVNLPTFARGGVSKSAAIFGEAGPEAAVPLPDGRRIPVDLRMPDAPRGQSGGAVSVSLTLNAPNSTAESVNALKADVMPQIKKLVQTEIVSMFDRNARFAKSGI